MRRIVMFGVVLSMVCWLWGASDARATTAIKLCGSANRLADSLIISGTFDQDGPFVMTTSWVQFVPTLYTLLGSGTIIRTIGDATTFSGGLTVTNKSDAFANNPVCAVAPVLQIEQLQPLTVSGSAELRCVAGPGDPFTVTISFTLIACNDPGPFGVASEQSAVSAFQGSPGSETKLPAGYAPNEYRP